MLAKILDVGRGQRYKRMQKKTIVKKIKIVKKTRRVATKERIIERKERKIYRTRSIAKINEICCNKVTNGGKQMKRGIFASCDS